MKIQHFACALAVSALSVLPARASLVISEVLANEVGSDTTGEWIEIFNNGSEAIDLSNYKIGDEETSGGTGTGESMFQFPSGASIAPGAVQIVAISASRFSTVYGFLPTYELNGSDITVPDLTLYSAWDPDGTLINMANSNDQLLILDENDLRVDAVSWGNTVAFNPGIALSAADGQSFERINPLIDTDTANDWQLGPTSTTAALRSTPGVVVVPEPSTWALMGCGIAAFGLFKARRFTSRKN